MEESKDTRPESDHARQVPKLEEVLDVTSLGGGITLDKTSHVVFNKEFAKKLLGYAEVKGDRPLRDRHVDHIMTGMLRDSFFYELVNLIIAFCTETNLWYRMNGQHCSWAVELLTDADLKKIGERKVKLLSYTCKTYEDVRLLYGSIDRNAPRTKRDVLNSQLFGSEEFKGMSRNAINAIANGFSFWNWQSEHERKKHDGDDVSYLLKTEYADLTSKIVELFRLSREFNKHLFLRTSPVIGAIFATFHKLPTGAVEFWSSVRDGTQLPSAQDPRLKLRNQLQSAKRTMGKSPTAFAEDTYGWCIHAWNAWRRKDKELTKLYGALPDGKRPVPK